MWKTNYKLLMGSEKKKSRKLIMLVCRRFEEMTLLHRSLPVPEHDGTGPISAISSVSRMLGEQTAGRETCSKGS